MHCGLCGRGGEPTTGTDTPLDACDCEEPMLRGRVVEVRKLEPLLVPEDDICLEEAQERDEWRDLARRAGNDLIDLVEDLLMMWGKPRSAPLPSRSQAIMDRWQDGGWNAVDFLSALAADDAANTGDDDAHPS